MTIKEVIKELGYTQQETAFLLGIPYHSFCNYLNDKGYLCDYDVKKLADFLYLPTEAIKNNFVNKETHMDHKSALLWHLFNEVYYKLSSNHAKNDLRKTIDTAIVTINRYRSQGNIKLADELNFEVIQILQQMLAKLSPGAEPHEPIN